MDVLSLFSGIEGFGVGFARAGMTVTHHVERDPHCRTVLESQFPSTRIIRDVRLVRPATIRSTPDVVCGGFPCQDLSLAGRREGLAGSRSGLWWEFHRIIGFLRPPWVVIENVPGLLSSNRGRDMGAILGALGELGYGWAYRIMDARWTGVPQRRRRVFIVGHLGTRTRAAEVLLEPEGGAGSLVPQQQGEVEVAHFDSHGAHTSPVLSFHHQNRIKESTPVFVDEAPTLMTAKVPLVYVDGSLRKLTPVECERLQGFPDDWTASLANTHRYRVLGNAVAVPVVEWLGKRMMN